MQGSTTGQATLTVLLVGGGGREHAIAWKLRQSPRVGALYIAPGSAGTATLGQNIAIAADDVDALVAFAHQQAVDLVVIGPEAPLAAGLVDAMQAAGLCAFGPSRAAAQLEASKAFAKTVMYEAGIPTAAYASFTDYAAARQYVYAQARPLVVKADGLAAGKGVILCATADEADEALRTMLVDSGFGSAGRTVVIEDWLTGPEVSVLAFCDGQTVVAMPPARDHKRAYDGDEGPNTGGMGAYAPAPDISPALLDAITQTVLRPAVQAMAARGTPYVGVLYAGLMLTPEGPRTLEFNCRFGDPETQALLPLLASDLLEIMLACVEGRLHEVGVHWRAGACATVVAASPGYPGAYPHGLVISGVDDDTDAKTHTDALVFHAGTARDDRGRLVTAGGRVLAVSAVGDTLDTALAVAYTRLARIHFDGIHYRRDIGQTVRASSQG